MKRDYLFVVRMDGDMCGIEAHELHVFDTDNPKDLTQFFPTIEDMARDHVRMYIDEDEYEEEHGTDMEVASEIFHYDLDNWGEFFTCPNGLWHNREGFNNIAQDENGFWYVVSDN